MIRRVRLNEIWLLKKYRGNKEMAKKAAVKIIDDRGIESLRILEL